jgi:hypothetical protein
MITALDCYRKYGDPKTNKSFMTMWDIPSKYEINQIPARLYCNKDLIKPLERAFQNLLYSKAINELCTWDGCYNVRVIRGYEKQYENLIKKGDAREANRLMSLHSWAVAIDVNAFENGLGMTPKLSPLFVSCFTDAGFDWGGTFKRRDGMHFQLSEI